MQRLLNSVHGWLPGLVVALAAAAACAPPTHAALTPSGGDVRVAERATPLANTQEFVDQAADVTERISGIGRSVGYQVEHADEHTDAELADRFQDLARRCGLAGQELKALDPPTRRAKRKVQALIVALRAVRKDLRHIADAAAASDPEAAGAATRDLVAHSPAVAEANRALKAEVRRLRAR